MGDRGVVKVVFEGAHGKKEELAVFFYTHWCGSDLPSRVQDGLRIAQKDGRLSDGSYLARIVFNNIQGEADPGETTGFGIAPDRRFCDNEHPVLVIDIPRQLVLFEEIGHASVRCAGKVFTIKEFVELADANRLFDY